MIKTVRTPAWLAFKRIILAIGIVGALHAMTMTGAAASTSCSAVNSGSFNLTNPAFDLGNTGTLSDWTVGDRIAATFTDAVGFSHLDGFFSGTPPAAIGTLNQVTVPSGSSATIMHTVVSADIANGILLDPENNDSVSATCVAALILTSTPSSTTKIGQTYFQTNVASGGTPAYTFSLFAGSLPSGTSLDTSTGLVSGPLTAAGTFNYTIKVTDSSPTPALTATQVISVTVTGSNASGTILTSSTNPSEFGSSVTFTAIVTGSGGSPTGTVTFNDGASTLGSGTLAGGTATLSTSALTVGTHTITAVYSGDAIFAPSISSALSQVVGVFNAWVSGVGIDTGVCSRDAPCQTFSYALSVTAAGGEINVLDHAGYGVATITKSITIRADHAEAGLLASGTNGIVISASATDRVVLEGLDIDGLNTGLNGVSVTSGGKIYVIRCAIRGFTQNGINMASSSAAHLFVNDSYLYRNVGGVNVAAAGNIASITNTRIFSNTSFAVQANNANAIIGVQTSVLNDNPTGIGNLVPGGQVISVGPNNLVTGAGAFTSTILFK